MSFASKHMPKEYAGKSTKLGMGGRMAMTVDEMMEERPGMTIDRARAIAAAAGRRTYGASRFQEMAAAGKRRAARKASYGGK